MTSKEAEFVELVDADGTAIGSATVAEAHTLPGRLHRAFSVMLVDDDGRVLLQQRAAVKTRFALRWANACCGHPAPGQAVTDAAVQRLVEEIGVRGVPVHEVGVHPYRAEDPATGRVEFEFDHVVVGHAPAGLALDPDPAEVADLRWVDPAELRADLAERPGSYSPWLAGVLAVTADAGPARS
jgi:isopentenyl-diphosphate Delta-isomerase